MLLGERHIRIFKQFYIDTPLDIFDEFIRTIEDQLKDAQQKYETRANEKRSKLDKQEEYEFLETYGKKSWILENEFPHMFRFAFFITCYVYLDNELAHICRFIEERNDYPTRLSDLPDKGIKLSQTYLKKVAGIINFPDQTPHWKDIQDYGVIRNVLIHNNGNLDKKIKIKDAEKIEVYIKNHPQLLKLGDHRDIQFTSEFLPKVVHTLRLFLNDFFDVWMAWARNVNAH